MAEGKNKTLAVADMSYYRDDDSFANDAMPEHLRHSCNMHHLIIV